MKNDMFLFSPRTRARLISQCVAELRSGQWLFPYDQLEMGEELGAGAFGVVKKAVAHNVRADGASIVVAVKMLKGVEAEFVKKFSCLVELQRIPLKTRRTSSRS